ncbi:MAG: ArnT family glycosyltransferase [Phycisphaerae bacterium]
MLALLLLYGVGLTRDAFEPWVGMHDWNGAFFSQLARNLLRYPLSLHHGMPVVAVGATVPPPEEYSIYATHPPGLVWLVAAAFKFFGESESVARLVPIAASLGSLVLLVSLVERAVGRPAALLCGLIYALMPMSVYFGRMVNHEAVCLFSMLAGAATWAVAVDSAAAPRRRAAAWLGWALALSFGIWVDWVVVLFVALSGVWGVVQFRRGRIGGRALAATLVIPAAATAGMVSFIVYEGLNGTWGDLAAIFSSRAGRAAGDVLERDAAAPGTVWTYVIENLTRPVALLAAIGAVAWVRRCRRGRVAAPSAEDARGRAARAGLMLISMTGLLWLAIFWRQFERHNYWLFYLGPAAAILAADALIHLGGWAATSVVRGAGRRLLRLGAVGSVLLVTGGLELARTRDYFARTSRPEIEVSTWRAIHERTKTGDRLLVYQDPVRTEQRGGYRFRNLVPPQWAYYLDRAFDVERDFARVIDRSDSHALFILPVRDAIARGEALAELRRRFHERLEGTRVVFDLRQKR